MWKWLAMSRFAALVLGVAALLGPSLRFAMWPLLRLEDMSERNMNTLDFIYHLVMYVWPGQLLALGTRSQIRGALLAIGANMILFTLIGGVVGGAAAVWKSAAFVLYAVHCVSLMLFAFWGSGFSLSYLPFLPLVVAMALYAIPYWIVARAAASHTHPG